MAKGDHIIVPLFGPTEHHGIDIGDGTVVHPSSGMPADMSLADVLKRLWAIEIRRTPIAHFGNVTRLRVRQYNSCDDADMVVERALSRVGERSYSLLRNNCEHFAAWCKTGEHRSEQVRDFATMLLGLSGTGVGGSVSIVSAAGAMRGLYNRGVVAGLGAVGRIAGGGATTGLALAASAPAVVSVLTVRAILNDDPSLPMPERDARTAGRIASLGGAVLGTAGSIGAVAAAGVPGLSAVGISTGLAALGGGCIALGLTAAIAFPAAVTFGAGWLAYRLLRRGKTATKLLQDQS